MSKKLSVTVDPGICRKISIAQSKKVHVWKYASGGYMLTLAGPRAKQPTTEREDLLIEIIETQNKALRGLG